MKISVTFLLVFIYSILYCSLGTTYITSSTDNIANTASSIVSENITNRDESITEKVVKSGESELNSNSDSDESAQPDFEENRYYTQENDLLEVAQNSGVAHEISGPSLDIIHTLADTATIELQDKADELSVAPTISDTSQYNSTTTLDDNLIPDGKVDNDIFTTENLLGDDELDDSENVNQTDEILNKVPSTEPKINITDETEDIPSFSEWTQRHLEEAERKKEEVNASIQNQFSNGKSSSSGKKRWKNYASPDCGAKIVAANPEAVNAGYVLTAFRDEYKLNICNSRIWFVVELCEPIQAKKIELANFELFSSSPKDCSISVSVRYPTRDWTIVGQFTAKDERDIQSFDLDHSMFGKFVKFEMHSHYGSEHYCPISFFRVFGTSEFEALETENQINVIDDDDDDETLDSTDGEPSKNLFSSATDAVISIVKKAAEALGNKGNRSKTVEPSENKTVYQYLPLVNSCTTPSHIIVCENCTDLLFGYVFELLSCNSKELGMLVNKPFIKNILYNTNICQLFGLVWQTKPITPLPDAYKAYMIAFFATKYIAAMCNTVAISECKTVLNVSHNATIIPQNIENVLGSKSPEVIPNITLEPSTETVEFATTVINTATSDIPVLSQIKPTKTLTHEENINRIDSSGTLETHINKPITEAEREILQSDKTEEVVSVLDDTPQYVEPGDLHSVITPSDSESVPENSEGLDDSLDTLVNEINEESSSTAPVTTISPPAQPQQQQKESVFLRLSNRLKNLELNMSLSSQYLEELSRRYKKQVEEMQRLLDKTIITLNEDNRKKEERAEHLEKQINELKEIVGSLIEERNSWVNVSYWFIFIVTITTTVLFCKRNTNSKKATADVKTQNNEFVRRKSISVVTHKSPIKKKRRPSEEALRINGTYKDLLIDNDVDQKLPNKKRKRRKQKLHKSNSVSTLTEESPTNENRVCRTIDGSTGFNFKPNLPSSRILNKTELRWVEKSTSTTHSNIQDIPFVLEESEHSSLEPLPPNFSANNDNKVRSTKFIVTPVNLSSSQALLNLNHVSTDSKVERTPSPNNTCNSSFNGSLPDDSLVELPRREKRNFLKRIFKNLSNR